MNDTAKRVLASVRDERRRRRCPPRIDWRFLGALALLLFAVSSVVGLFTITRQRDAQSAAFAALVDEVAVLIAQNDRLEEQAAAAEERAAEAARQAARSAELIAENNRVNEEIRAIAMDLDQVLLGQTERDAQRGPLIDQAIRRILTDVGAGNADIVAALRELSVLVQADSAILERLDRLIAEAEAEAADDERPSAGDPATTPPPVPPPSSSPPSTTTTAATTTTTTAPPPVLIAPDGERVPLDEVG